MTELRELFTSLLDFSKDGNWKMITHIIIIFQFPSLLKSSKEVKSSRNSVII